MLSPARPLFRLLRWIVAAAIVIAVGLMVWGSDLLIASDPEPQHVDAAVVLQGSVIGERARTEGAIRLLQRGVADRVVLSIPKEGYWGQSIPPIARAYLEKIYGPDLAARIDFCETSGDVNSTVQEAQAVSACIHEHHWQSVMIVTSDYHTRRAGMLWRRMSRPDSNLHIWVDGVKDPEFEQPWWRHRQSAKIWLMESSKLMWTVLGGR
jgi:uncharacterized SAM-binding protein YcdF (DUF218 family)